MILIKSQQMITSLKNIQRAKSKSRVGLLKSLTVLRVYLLHKRMPNSKKMYPVVHKIMNKEKETSKSKEK